MKHRVVVVISTAAVADLGKERNAHLWSTYCIFGTVRGTSHWLSDIIFPITQDFSIIIFSLCVKKLGAL